MKKTQKTTPETEPHCRRVFDGINKGGIVKVELIY